MPLVHSHYTPLRLSSVTFSGIVSLLLAQGKLNGQTLGSDNGRLVHLQNLIQTNGRAASVTPTMTVKYTQSIDSIDRCRVVVHRQTETDGSTVDRFHELLLQRLPPAVTVEPWEKEPLYSVVLSSSSGGE